MKGALKILKTIIISIIALLFLGGVSLFIISICIDGTFDYCGSNSEAKKVFEERIEYINTLLEEGKIATLKEEEGYTNNYYSQEYEIVNDNEEMNITMLCYNNQLTYSFSWKKYGKSVNFEYTEQEVERVTKILNSISKKKFSSEEIYEFINAEESKYSVERYGFKKYYELVDKIKHLNGFTRDAAFEHSIWSTDNGYSSLFSLNGKFIKELDNK